MLCVAEVSAPVTETSQYILRSVIGANLHNREWGKLLLFRIFGSFEIKIAAPIITHFVLSKKNKQNYTY